MYSVAPSALNAILVVIGSSAGILPEKLTVG